MQEKKFIGIMFDKGKSSENVEIQTHNIALRNRNKVKLKNKFSGLTKLHNSTLWESLTELKTLQPTYSVLI